MHWFLSDPQEWATSNFGRAELGDPRRTRRLVQMATAFAIHPSGSLPQQQANWSDLKAAYNLLKRPETTFEAVCQPHFDLRQRCDPGRYLILGDTTEADFGPRRKIKGVGPLGNGSGRGFLLHSGLLVHAGTGELCCLAGAQLLQRRPAPKKETSTQRLARARETDRWGETVDLIGPPPTGVEWIHVWDREGDNYEAFCRCLNQRCDLVVRARALKRKIYLDEGGKHSKKLREALEGLPVATTRTLHVPAKAKTRDQPARQEREATVEVRYGRVWVPMPKERSPYLKAQAQAHASIRMSVVWVREVSTPPAGQERVEWVLYTTLAVTSLAEAEEVVGYYRKRWLIEEYHKAIKSGTQIKRRQLREGEALAPLIGLSAIEAVRLVQMKTLARSEPGRLAEGIVPKAYVRMLAAALGGKKQVETVRDFFRGVAQLGGFLGRKGDGEPGWQTIWHGWEKLAAFLRGAELVHTPPDSDISG